MTNQNEEAVRRFEEEFKNKANLGVADELMTSDFVHHLPYPGLPPGPRGMKATELWPAGGPDLGRPTT